MNIVIDNVDYWDGFDAQKYWVIPRSHDHNRAREEVKSCMLSGSYIGSQKRDGIWAMIIKDIDGNFHLRSRSKNVENTYADKAEWIPHITKELNGLPNGTVLLGELYKKGDEGSRKATAILNCLKEKSLERQTKTPLTFYCFDCLAYKNKSLLNEAIETRVNHYLYYELLDILKNNNYIELAEYKEGQELWDLCGEILNAGYEGMVIQKKTAKYLCGKRKAWDSIKVKKELSDTIDAFLDGNYKLPTMEYNGKEIENWPYWMNAKTHEKYNDCRYEEYLNGAPLVAITKPYYNNWASAVSFSVMKDGKPVHIAYISGITDELKQGIITDANKWIGKVASLTAMEIEKIDGQYSLRHGKIDTWRSDKKPEDCDWSQISNEK